MTDRCGEEKQAGLDELGRIREMGELSRLKISVQGTRSAGHG